MLLLGYSFALAEYYYGRHRSGAQASAQDMMFQASFKAPKVNFLCNHEAIVEINIDEGHYNVDYACASETAIAEQ